MGYNNKEYYTSCTMFGDATAMKELGREYDSVSDMDSAIVMKWNNLVREDDDVWHLGDFGDFEMVKKLSGRVNLIMSPNDMKRLEQKGIDEEHAEEYLQNLGFSQVFLPGTVWGDSICEASIPDYACGYTMSYGLPDDRHDFALVGENKGEYKPAPDALCVAMDQNGMNLVDSNRLKFYFLGLDDIYDEIPDDNNDVYGNDDVNENSACQLFKCEFPVSQSLTQLILERFSNFVLEFVEHNDKTNMSYPIDFTFSEVKYSDKERVVLSGQLIVSFNPIGVGTIEYKFKTQEYNRVSYSEKTTRSRKIHSLMVHNTELSDRVLDLVSRFNDLPF